MKRSSLLMGVFFVLQIAFADQTIFTVHENGNIEQYKVASNAVLWTWEKTFLGRDTEHCGLPQSIDGKNGLYYVADIFYQRGRLSEFLPDGTFRRVIATFPYIPESVVLSKDGKWAFISSMKGNVIYRYRIADGSGGVYLTSSDIDQPREITFGEDGLLYLADRGIGDATKRGVKAFDVSGDVPILRAFYPTSNAVGGVVVNTETKSVYVQGRLQSFRFDLVEGDTPQTNRNCESISHQAANAFSSFRFNGIWFLGDYWTGGLYSIQPGTIEKQATIKTQVRDFFVLGTEDVRQWKWSFDEAENASVFLSHTGDKIIPRQALQSGAEGIDGTGLWFSKNSRGELENSQMFIPVTNDFSILFWAAVPTNDRITGERIFVNNNFMQANRCGIALNLGGFHPHKVAWFHNGGTNLISASSIDDGRWHQIGVIRRDNQFELWVDGNREAAGFSSAPMSQSGNWQIGMLGSRSVNALQQGFFDELLFAARALSESEVQSAFQQFTPNGIEAIPTPSYIPPLPTPDFSAVAPLGTVVAHVSGCVGTVGRPALLIHSDGTWYAAHDLELELGKTDNVSILYQSNDQGEQWSSMATNNRLRHVALFEAPDARLSLVGLPYDAKTPHLQQFTMGIFSNPLRISSRQMDNFQGSAPLLLNGRMWMACYEGLFSFAMDESGNPTGTSFENNQYSFAINTEYALKNHTVPVGVLTETDSMPLAIFRPSAVKPLFSQDRSSFLLTGTSSGSSPLSINRSIPLPGATHDATLLWDETSGLYWTATFPKRSDGANRISLYTSPDLGKWAFRQDIITSTDADITLSSPVLGIAGDNLVLLFRASAPDGIAPPRDKNAYNYLLARTIVNFRTIEKEGPAERFILLAHTSENVVRKYWKSSQGEWVYGGDFAKGTYGGVQLVSPQAIHTIGRHVYLAGENLETIFEFNVHGEFIRIFQTFPGCKIDALGSSADGRWLYVGDSFGSNMVFRCRRTTGEKEIWIPAGGTIVSKPRAILGMADGSVLIANRNNNEIIRVNADGQKTETVLTDFSQPQAFAFHEKSQTLYIGTGWGGYEKIFTYCNDTLSSPYTFPISGVMGMGFYDEDLLCSTYTPGFLAETRLDGTSPFSGAISGSYATGRFVVVDLHALAGTILLLK